MIIALMIYFAGFIFTFGYINLTFRNDWEWGVFWHCWIFVIMSWLGAILFYDVIKSANK